MKLKILAVAVLVLTSLPSFAATVHVSWTNPTQYTDSTSLPPADITQSRIEWGSCNGTAFGTKISEAIVPGNVTSGDITLAPATYCIRVYTTAKGVESGPSNVATKSITQPPPKPPVLTTIDVTAYEIKPQNNLVKVAGSVELGVECRSTTQTIAGITYTELDPATVDYRPGNRPVPVWGICEAQN